MVESDLSLQTLNFVEGRWQSGEGQFEVLDKFDSTVIAKVDTCSKSQLDKGLAYLQSAINHIQWLPIQRSRLLESVVNRLQSRRDLIVSTMVAETGFTIADCQGDFDRTLVTFQLCAMEALQLNGETVSFAASPDQQERLGFTIRLPLGVVAAITPFNSPLNTVAHKVGPALAAGNAVVLKPSNLTPLSALLLIEDLLEAGCPPELISVVNGPGAEVGRWLVESSVPSFFAFTGSTEVGLDIQSRIGIRRSQMELGSIASTIVCEDADMIPAVEKTAKAAFRKAGQVCTSTQRLFVAEAILDDFCAAFISRANSLAVGDPQDPKTDIGPLISSASAERAMLWVREAQTSGAQILAGGQIRGACMTPTIVTGVKQGARLREKEIFAPCVVVIPFRELDQAISEANDSPFGLSAGIFTRDIHTALRGARQLRFGTININAASSARGDGMPFGGVKMSGFGKEGPKYAVREMTEERLITINP